MKNGIMGGYNLSGSSGITVRVLRKERRVEGGGGDEERDGQDCPDVGKLFAGGCVLRGFEIASDTPNCEQGGSTRVGRSTVPGAHLRNPASERPPAYPSHLRPSG